MSAEADVDKLAEAVAIRVAGIAAQTEYVDQYTSGIHRPIYVSAARAGEFPAVRVKRRWIARRADVARWFAALTERQAAKAAAKKQPQAAAATKADIMRAIEEKARSRAA